MSAVLEGAEAVLRPMRETDIEAVTAIEQQVAPAPWNKGIFNSCLRVNYSCWIWEQDDEVIGYGVMSLGAGEAHILNLGVEPGQQGQGLGRAMLEHLLSQARQRGAETAFLEVRPSNKAAIGLYNSMGFNQVGLRSNYYPTGKGREDALIMALSV